MRPGIPDNRKEMEMNKLSKQIFVMVVKAQVYVEILSFNAGTAAKS